MKGKDLFRIFLAALLFSFTFTYTSCSSGDDDDVISELVEGEEEEEEDETGTTAEWTDLTASPDTWDGNKIGDISYQLLVYSFADNDGNGMGDLKGLINKLDYIDELGVSAIWLSPINPATSYHGYDVTDYTTVNSDYGSMTDFENLVTAAHNKNIKIYLDFVMNHTSSEHPWFTDAKASTTSDYRNYFIFSQDPETDIKAGSIAMIEKTGYDSSEWFSIDASDATTIDGYYKFVLDWSNSSSPTVTVTEATSADVDADNPDTSTTDAKYLYYGDGVCKKFYDKGNGAYQLTVHLQTTWGFLIRTSNDSSWPTGTKYGANSSSSKVTLGTAFSLYQSDNAANILFESQNLWYYHSDFSTSSFADLNYGEVDEVSSNATYLAMLDAAKGWVDKGVDGLRLDAVKHIYHDQDGTENPQFLNTFYTDMNNYYQSKGNSGNFYMVGEVMSDMSSESWFANYFQGLPALFDFSYWYRLQWAIPNHQGYYFANDIIGYQTKYASVRSDYIEATKLSNHDEDRTASVLSSTDQCKLAAAVLLTSGGSPYIYYGEELGMTGKTATGDENVRGPMPWGDSYTTSSLGITTSVSDVTTQKADESSLLNTYLTFTKLRNTYPALAEGTMTEHDVYNHSNTSYKTIAAWYMTKDSQKILVLHNFGSSAIELPLTDSVQKAIAVLGSVQQKEEESTVTLKMGAYSSAVFIVSE